MTVRYLCHEHMLEVEETRVFRDGAGASYHLVQHYKRPDFSGHTKPVITTHHCYGVYAYGCDT